MYAEPINQPWVAALISTNMRIKPFVLQTKMLYLEDYLEMIEHLPIELRDRFTEMREIDLGVENTVDSLEVQKTILYIQTLNFAGKAEGFLFSRCKYEPQ